MKHNRKIVRALAVLTIFAILMSGCTQIEQQRYSADFLKLFNTATRIIGYADSKEAFEEQAQFVYERLQYYHNLYNKFEAVDGMHNVYTINQMAGKEPVVVEPALMELLVFGQKQAYQISDGKLNVMIGAVTDVWHTYRARYADEPEDARLPRMEELRAAQEHTAIDLLVLDPAAQTAYIRDPQARLDVGAIAKGFAVERVAQEARAAGITDLLISVGGNVVAIGNKQDERGRAQKWSIGVQNPDPASSEEITPSLKLRDQSLVSSGDYERYYMVDGERYAHIIDPDTLMPSRMYRQVTVLAQDSGVADACSTALYMMSIEAGKRRAHALGVEAMWVKSDGSIEYTDGFRSYETE